MIPIWLLSGRLGNQMFQFAYLLAQQKRGETPDVYLQYPKFFEGAEAEIRQAFSEGIRRTPHPYVGVHVRRGDYVGHRMFVDLCKDTTYYERAFRVFPGHQFRIFSDDIPWCRSQWGGDPRFAFSEGGNEIEDFNNMASCQHNIIANSSFSWWAAWLNPNPLKQVVYPQQWHTDKVDRVGFPKEWMCL